MTRKIVIGVAWWLTTAYAFQFAGMMYGFPGGIGVLAAIPIAYAIAATRPQRVRRPADLRRIYQPRETEAVAGEPSVLSGR